MSKVLLRRKRCFREICDNSRSSTCCWIQTVTTNVNVVDVNATTRSKATKEHVFKDRQPRKTNSYIDQEKKKS